MGFREMMARRKEGQDELDQELMDEQGDEYQLGDPAMTPPDPMGAGKPQERDEESILQDALPDSPEALAALTGGTGMDIPDFGTQEPGPEEPGMEEMGMDPNAGMMGMPPPGMEMSPGMPGVPGMEGPHMMPGGPQGGAPGAPPPPPGPPQEDPLAAARRQMAGRIAGGGV